MVGWMHEDEDHWVVVVVEGGPFHQSSSWPMGRRRHFVKVVLQQALLAAAQAPPRGLVMRTSDLCETVLLLLTLHKTIRHNQSTTSGGGCSIRGWFEPHRLEIHASSCGNETQICVIGQTARPPDYSLTHPIIEKPPNS